MTCCGSVRCQRFRTCSCPHCVRRSSTTHGFSSSTRRGRPRTSRRYWGETFGEGGAPSGAASTEQPPSTSGNSCSAAPLNSSGTSSSAGGLVVGGVPRTDQEICVEATSVATGGDPKTDHSLFVGMACVDSPLRGGGWQPKLPLLLLPALITLLSHVFQKFAMDVRVRLRFPRFVMD